MSIHSTLSIFWNFTSRRNTCYHDSRLSRLFTLNDSLTMTTTLCFYLVTNVSTGWGVARIPISKIKSGWAAFVLIDDVSLYYERWTEFTSGCVQSVNFFEASFGLLCWAEVQQNSVRSYDDQGSTLMDGVSDLCRFYRLSIIVAGDDTEVR